jgi:hypothetical protein
MIIPPTKWRKVKGAKARNHLLYIEQTPGLPFGAPRYAQEIREHNLKAFPALAVGLVALIAALVAVWPIGAFYAVLAALVAAVAGTVITNNAISGTRRVEYAGKAIEWRAAVRFYGADAAGYLLSEARELAPYPQFRAVPLDTIVAGIEAQGGKADKWLDAHWLNIKQAYYHERKNNAA